jgi:hypothetical protein
MRKFVSWMVLTVIFAACDGGSPVEVQADAPELASWKLNTTGATGYGGLPAEVQRVRYSNNYVYVNSSGIPDYSIGPWPGNPNTPANQNYVFKIPRFPVVNNGTRTATSLGSIAVWVNGVAVFNALDAHSYNNQNIWHQDAVLVEATSFDACLGHPAPGGVYHHHQNPRCLDTPDAGSHSPILGFSYDGFPIYGPYAHAGTDGTGGITRMQSSYRLRNITARTTRPDGTALQPAQYGPAVSASFPLGYYVEDYEFVGGLGHLDAHNGRFAVTPEYPQGTYAYYVTINETGASAYPYAIGPTYYGVVATENTSTGGHVTISEAVTDYDPGTSGLPDGPPTVDVALGQNSPNPFRTGTTISYSLPSAGYVRLSITDVTGRLVATLVDQEQAGGDHHLFLPAAIVSAPGLYFYRLVMGDRVQTRKMLFIR